MAKSMRYPIGIQHFPKLMEGGFVYIDKTMYIKKLLAGAGYYFMSRPRRFGKSLLLSTMEAYFEGRRDLFKGLAIDADDIDWTPRPVIKLSFNTLDPKTKDSIEFYINDCLVPYEKIYGRDKEVLTLSQRLASILANAYEQTGRKAAVLIDEYDAPLLSTLEDAELNGHYRDTLKSIFSVLKSSDRHIEFAFVTGVSRFSHTSLFSGANNLRDISFEEDYAGICGITEEELRKNLAAAVGNLAESLNIPEPDAFGILKENYDGYHFSGKSPDLYNPFSLFNALSSQKLDNYWFRSGTPTYLLNLLKRDDFYLPDLDSIESMESELGITESYINNPVALLYESGYVTIKDYDEESMLYKLGLPNMEVATSFTKALLPLYSGIEERTCFGVFNKMRSAVVGGRAEAFMELLCTFLSGNPYSNTELTKREVYFKNNIYLIFRALGFLPRVEEETSHSRMDVMLETRRFVYIFELKTDGNTAAALRQIEERGYAQPYRCSGKTIIKIAANYGSAINNIDSWEISEDAPQPELPS